MQHQFITTPDNIDHRSKDAKARVLESKRMDARIDVLSQDDSVSPYRNFTWPTQLTRQIKSVHRWIHSIPSKISTGWFRGCSTLVLLVDAITIYACYKVAMASFLISNFTLLYRAAWLSPRDQVDLDNIGDLGLVAAVMLVVLWVPIAASFSPADTAKGGPEEKFEAILFPLFCAGLFSLPAVFLSWDNGFRLPFYWIMSAYGGLLIALLVQRTRKQMLQKGLELEKQSMSRELRNHQGIFNVRGSL